MKGRHSITWHINAIRVGRRGRNFISLAICEKTGRAAFFAIFDPNKPATQEALKTLLIKDIYADQNGCEDGVRCLDLDCQHNKAKHGNFRQYKVDTKEKLRNLSKHIQSFRSDLDLHIDPNGGNYYYEKPIFIILKKPMHAGKDNVKE